MTGRTRDFFTAQDIVILTAQTRRVARLTSYQLTTHACACKSAQSDARATLRRAQGCLPTSPPVRTSTIQHHPCVHVSSASTGNGPSPQFDTKTRDGTCLVQTRELTPSLTSSHRVYPRVYREAQAHDFTPRLHHRALLGPVDTLTNLQNNLTLGIQLQLVWWLDARQHLDTCHSTTTGQHLEQTTNKPRDTKAAFCVCT